MFYTCLSRRTSDDPTIFFCDWHTAHKRIQKLFFISWANVGNKKKNEMRDEVKTWWLVFRLDVASSYFLKKIRVALESRDSRSY